MVRAVYKGLAYRLLDAFEGVHARATRRAWYTPGAAAAEEWIRTLAISGAGSGIVAGQPSVSLQVQNGITLSGPAEQANWNSMAARVARMQRIARRSGVEGRLALSPAHYALLDNIVNRYVAEFCAYPYQSLRTMNLLPGDVFVDIGAFRGYVAVKAARRVGERGKVYAIEPIEENFRFVEHHRDVNRLENLVALQGAVTPDVAADTVDFFRTENQGNACIEDHLKGNARTIKVVNIGASALLDKIRREMPGARRIVCSLTTNGTEMTVAQAMMDAFDRDNTGGYLEITIPVIFTMHEARKFSESASKKGWRSDFHYPWLRLWRAAEAG
jgi:FkbM family methyltransferase